ncbi:MAG: hypothetical protein ABIH99_04650 [Candidatus Micrarchaeota archaeon]
MAVLASTLVKPPVPLASTLKGGKKFPSKDPINDYLPRIKTSTHRLNTRHVFPKGDKAFISACQEIVKQKRVDAIPALIKALKTRTDPDILEATIDTLAKLKAVEATSELINILKMHENPQIIEPAIFALAEFNAVDAGQEVMNCLESAPSPRVRIAATFFVGKLKLTKYTSKIGKRHKFTLSEEKAQVIRTLGELGATKFIPKLKEDFYSGIGDRYDNPDVDIQSAAIEALAKLNLVEMMPAFAKVYFLESVDLDNFTNKKLLTSIQRAKGALISEAVQSSLDDPPYKFTSRSLYSSMLENSAVIAMTEFGFPLILEKLQTSGNELDNAAIFYYLAANITSKQEDQFKISSLLSHHLALAREQTAITLLLISLEVLSKRMMQ